MTQQTNQSTHRPLSRLEAAEFLGVSPATLTNWEKAGRFSPDLGNGLYSLSHLADFSGQDAFKSLCTRRRNKMNKAEKLVPSEYVDAGVLPGGYTELLSDLSDRYPEALGFILQSLAVKYLADRGFVKNSIPDGFVTYADSPEKVRFVQGPVMGKLVSGLCPDPPSLPIRRGIVSLIHKIKFPPSDFDLLGFTYLCLKNNGARKRQGQYYTPAAVCRRIIGTLGIEDSEPAGLTVLDPACGTGQFLMEVYRVFMKLYLARGVDAAEAHGRILTENLRGYELDPTAALLTKINLLCLGGFPVEIEPRIYVRDFLADDNGQKEEELSGCHCIVGNPPWGAAIPAERKNAYAKRFITGRQHINTFSLFYEQAVRKVRDGGKVSLLVPEAVLNIKAYRNLRQFLLEETDLLYLETCGNIFNGVFSPAVILTSQKKSSSKAAGAKLKIIHRGETATGSQDSFWKNPDLIFNIHQTRDLESIYERIAGLQVVYLKNNALFGLGVVTGDNRRFLSERKLTPEYLPILTAKDVRKFTYTFNSKYFPYDRDRLQQVAPHHIYTAPEKLIYKFIGNKLVFAYDDRQFFVLNNLNIVIPGFDNLSVKCVLALLNSEFIQYIYEKTFFTVKVLRSNLEKLPLVVPPLPVQKIMEELVDCLCENSEDSREDLMDELNEMVYKLYHCSRREKEMIKFVQRPAANYRGPAD